MGDGKGTQGICNGGDYKERVYGKTSTLGKKQQHIWLIKVSQSKGKNPRINGEEKKSCPVTKSTAACK